MRTNRTIHESNTWRNAKVLAIQTAHATRDMVAAVKAEQALTVFAGSPIAIGFSTSDLKFQAARLHRNFEDYQTERGTHRDLRGVLEHKQSIVERIEAKLDRVQQQIIRKGGIVSRDELRPLVEDRNALAKDLEDLQRSIREISAKIRGIRGAGMAIECELKRRQNPAPFNPIVKRAPAPAPVIVKVEPVVVAKIEPVHEPEVKTAPIALRISRKAKRYTKRDEISTKSFAELEDLLINRQMSDGLVAGTMALPEALTLTGTARDVAALVFEKTGEMIAEGVQLKNKQRVIQKAALVLESHGYCIAA